MNYSLQIIFPEGNVVDIGTFEELMNAGQNDTFSDLVKELASKEEMQVEADEAIAEEEDDVLHELVGVTQRRERFRSTSVQSEDGPQPPPDTGRLIEEEEVAVGKVSYKMYLSYIKAFGVGLALCYVFALFFVRTVLESSSQVWMAKWSSSSATNETAGFSNAQSLGIYGAFSMSSCVVIGSSLCIIALGACRASTKLYDDLIFSLLRSPMSFFDQTPMGRIMNRVSNDIESIDFVVPQNMSFIAKLAADCVFYIASATYIMPQLGLLIIPGVIVSIMVVVSLPGSWIEYFKLRIFSVFTPILRCKSVAWFRNPGRVLLHTLRSHMSVQQTFEFSAPKMNSRNRCLKDKR